MIEERIRKRSSARQYHEKDKPTCSLVRSMIVESSLKRFRNGGVTGKITGKEIVRTGRTLDVEIMTLLTKGNHSRESTEGWTL